MKTFSRIIAILSLLFASVSSWGAVDLEQGVKDILKLKMTPDEAVDSVNKFFSLPEVNVLDSLQASIAESILRGRVVKYAVKYNAPDNVLAKIYDNIGLMGVHQGPNQIQQVRKDFDKALEYAMSAKDPFLQGVIFEHKAQAETKYGEISDSFKFSEEAIKRYKQAGAVAELRIVRCYYAQAVAYLRSADLDGMKKVIDNIDGFSKIVSAENRAHTLYNLYSVQEAYYGTKSQEVKGDERKALLDSLNQASLASVLLIDAHYDDWKTGSIDPTWNYYNRAVLFLESSDRPDIDSIEYYLKKALGVEQAGYSHNIEAEISAASLRAEMWMKYGDYNKAKNILLDAIKMLDNTEGINNVVYDKIEIYKNLVEISRQSGHYQEALEYAGLLSAAEKERFSIEKSKDIKELEIQYKTQETELALAHSEAKRANVLMWLFAAVGLLLLLAIGFVAYAGRQRRIKMQKEMEFTALREDIVRQLTQQYVEGLESERRRMSSELHDGVCNDLLAIQMNLTGGKSLESTARLIDNCRESVRRISHELMPPEFSYASIEEVVRFFVAKQKRAHEGKIEFEFTSSIAEGPSWQEVPDRVALEVYRIIQEAVGNAVRHSGASEINVSLSLMATALNVEIRDNGTFKSGGKKGLGLESISRRAKSVNGTAEILSSENNSTEVRVNIKL